MQKRLRPARTETFEHTISGLLTKRRDMLHEAERIRDRQAEIRSDVQALDRTLSALGFKGDIDATMPRQKRNVIFGRGELLRAILDELRDAEGPLRSREIAQALIAVRGEDPRDQKYIADLTRRVGKALRPLRVVGSVATIKDSSGCSMWKLS